MAATLRYLESGDRFDSIIPSDLSTQRSIGARGNQLSRTLISQPTLELQFVLSLLNYFEGCMMRSDSTEYRE
ncbi:uncharacterized protein PHALS_12075 [Plasmopara halstedii]|uniref:Uncharacterized protein n=1 Tax=Plasmopara halstedii TaxID=4781 RepID=A0A0P1AKU4_PLAHL|nr:uncharacterized protein PHALS_12075 [Plasmopara halstedii]CEG41746.1 hypothetical protein PHALS_12075 [Plasmopara halstedii]|eukprot:XP_024578115.1 hypothetical protein PHALS_12075 [Plasmopara halstedii]